MKKVDYEHFSRFSFPHNLRVHNDDLFFTVKRADMDDNDYKSDLFRISSDGRTVRLTHSGDVDSFFCTDKGILFSSCRNPKDKESREQGRPFTVFYILPYDGGEAYEWKRLDYSVSNVFFISEDRFIFTAGYSQEYARKLAYNSGDVDKTLKEMKDDADYQVLDELPFWYNGGGFVNKKRSRLYLYDNGSVRALSDEYTGVSLFDISEDKKRIIYSVNRYEDMQQEADRLLVLDIDSLSAFDISVAAGASHYDAQFVDGSRIVITASIHKQYGVNENPRVYLCDLANKTRVELLGSGEHSMGDSVGSDVIFGPTIRQNDPVIDNRMFFISTLDDSSHIMAIDLSTKEISRISNKRGRISEFVRYGEGFAAVALRGINGPEIISVSLDGEEDTLTDLNAALSQEYETSAPRDIFYTNSKGTVIHGFIIPPVNFEEGRKYPAILDIHGGPKTVYGNCYFHEMQLWAGLGYAVIFCNPTGGDGRGDVFADIRGHYGDQDYLDIMGFLDQVISENDYIDADRLGVTGGSYGGFMTNWIIGHTDRFKAAASQRSISNWLSFFGVSDIGPLFSADQTDATPWNDPVRMWEQSPLKYADNVKTPTLFIHSDQDYRCPLDQGLQMFSALRYNGIDTRLCMFKGENHELSRSGKPKHRVRRLREITEWFEKYLKN